MNILLLSSKLISIESTKEKPDKLLEILDVCAKELKNINFKQYLINKVPSVLYYNTLKFPNKFKIILNAHLDVVPGKLEQFRPKVKNDKLFGRGSVDMKAAAAVEILVFKEIAQKVKYPLGLQLVTDEEIGGFNGTAFQIKKNVRANFVITGEPTQMQIINKAKGILWLKIKTLGKSAHAAHLWDGINSNLELINVLNKIFKKYPESNGPIWKTTINLSKLLTNNDTFNKVPDYSEAWLDIRYIPGDNERTLNYIKSLLPLNCSMEIILNESVHNTDVNNLYIKLLQKSFKKYQYKKTDINVEHFASDIRHFNGVNNDGICFGPIGEGLHSDVEWVSIKSLVQYYQILKDFLLSLNS
jgi:succinyl-diaminopimelate desuccinylase